MISRDRLQEKIRAEEPETGIAWARITATGTFVAILLCTALLLPGAAAADPPVPGECPVDLDRDGIVGASDLNILAGAWMAQPGDPAWDATMDFDGDRIIGAADRGVIAAFWGATDCSMTDLPPATVWTGTAEYHDEFCPNGEVVLEMQGEGADGFRMPMLAEECLRSPVTGLALYSCEVNGTPVNSLLLEVIPGENVTSDGHHVCDPAEVVN